MTITIKFYIDAAKAKGWKVEWIDEERNVIAIYPPNEEPIIIRNNVTELASAVGSAVSNLKSASTVLAQKVGFLVPDTMVIEENESYDKASPMLGKYPRLVVKPMDGAFGDGVSTNVTTADGLKSAVEAARKHNVKSKAVVVQQFCAGRDYRLFILDGKVVAAIERMPLSLVGDGKHTIDELLDIKIDSVIKRDDYKIKPIDIIKDEIADHLGPLSLDKVLQDGEFISVQGVANLSKGGEAIDVTDEVNPALATSAVNLARLLRMDMCAVDVLSDDIFKDPTEAGTVFIEINVAPGFRGHYYPTVGKKRELAPLILDTILRKRKEH
jgi:cyanophycin synthetase